MLNKIRENLEELERLEKIATEAENVYEADPENEDAEKAFDEAYKAEFAQYMKLSEMIAGFANIEPRTARTMVRANREQLTKILSL